MSLDNERTETGGGKNTVKRPEWTPEDGGAEFATRVMDGVRAAHDGMAESDAVTPPHPRAKRRELAVGDYVGGVLSGDRVILSRAITLVESNAQPHFETAARVVKEILPHSGKSVRVGITGVPGAGKSTFIDALGFRLCDRGHKVAVLAVDPSSSVTKGSILGDKTRMENLSRHKNAFIRPSPSGGTLGGLTRKSRETMLMCEAAGYDVILVETVGVGQSEAAVRSMVDFFLLMVLTGAGDELQGIKKGVMELADAIIVNKADGGNVVKADATRAEYDRILHYLRPATEGWETKAHKCSAATGDGIDEIWELIGRFMETVKRSGVFGERRRQQVLSWVYTMVEDYL
ncbi:MAG: methylmalonyl Co-A mutase-associated GTPase MeaB, partial [Synergistaceae bacterium]|nr:methylmalonyl Co-A mutase-associated GTPase MeaB [Synergistaceae bacterium]